MPKNRDISQIKVYFTDGTALVLTPSNGKWKAEYFNGKKEGD